MLDAFNRFDTDRSGSISRDELGEAGFRWGWCVLYRPTQSVPKHSQVFLSSPEQVLKTLESSQWDDASIDQLLTAADASGDGQLQIEECEQQPFAASDHDLQLVISVLCQQLQHCRTSRKVAL